MWRYMVQTHPIRSKLDTILIKCKILEMKIRLIILI